MLRFTAIFFISSLLTATSWAADCPLPNIDEHARLKKIYDGDTVQLSDNRRLRLISINTPELAYDSRPAQPLATDARDATKQFLGHATIGLTLGARRQDRYNRLLAHITHPQTGSLEAYLVKNGLAFPVAFPPDVGYSACLDRLAEDARQQKIGIWSHQYWQPIPAIQPARFTEEFRRVCGTVSKIDRAGPLWVELQGDLVIRINQNDWSYFANSDFELNNTESWIGKKIELWGWLQNRRDDKQLLARSFKPWSIQARSPYVMRWIDQCE